MASPASCLQPVLPTKGLHKAPRLCVLYICDRSYISVNTEAEQKWCAQSNRWGTLSTSAIPSFWYLLSSATTPCCFLLQEVIKQKIGYVELRAHITQQNVFWFLCRLWSFSAPRIIRLHEQFSPSLISFEQAAFCLHEAQVNVWSALYTIKPSCLICYSGALSSGSWDHNNRGSSLMRAMS